MIKSSKKLDDIVAQIAKDNDATDEMMEIADYYVDENKADRNITSPSEAFEAGYNLHTEEWHLDGTTEQDVHVVYYENWSRHIYFAGELNHTISKLKKILKEQNNG